MLFLHRPLHPSFSSSNYNNFLWTNETYSSSSTRFHEQHILAWTSLCTISTTPSLLPVSTSSSTPTRSTVIDGAPDIKGTLLFQTIFESASIVARLRVITLGFSLNYAGFLIYLEKIPRKTYLVANTAFGLSHGALQLSNWRLSA